MAEYITHIKEYEVSLTINYISPFNITFTHTKVSVIHFLQDSPYSKTVRAIRRGGGHTHQGDRCWGSQ